MFAKTSKAASRISEQIRNNLMKKEYYAIVIGKTQKHDRYLDYLLKLDNNITVVSENGKEAILDYQLIDYKDGLSLVKINLETGRSHQIRVQFSHHGHPLYGDQKYNNLINKKAQICLFASSLSLKHPITNQVMTFTEPVPCNYPWNIFKI